MDHHLIRSEPTDCPFQRRHRYVNFVLTRKEKDWFISLGRYASNYVV